VFTEVISDASVSALTHIKMGGSKISSKLPNYCQRKKNGNINRVSPISSVFDASGQSPALRHNHCSLFIFSIYLCYE